MKIKRSQFQIKRMKPVEMTDNEGKLRLGVPDNLVSSAGEMGCGMASDPVKGPRIPHNNCGKKSKKGMY